VFGSRFENVAASERSPATGTPFSSTKTRLLRPPDPRASELMSWRWFRAAGVAPDRTNSPVELERPPRGPGTAASELVAKWIGDESTTGQPSVLFPSYYALRFYTSEACPWCSCITAKRCICSLPKRRADIDLIAQGSIQGLALTLALATRWRCMEK
jgi:hypothetical protein